MPFGYSGGMTTNYATSRSGGSTTPRTTSSAGFGMGGRPMAGAGGAGGTDLNGLMSSFSKGNAAANKAKLGQYKNLMGSVKDTGAQMRGGFDQANKLMSGYGKSAMADVEQNRVNARGDAEQDLISRGLGNLTIRGTALRGVDDDAQRSKERIGEGVAMQKAGLAERQAGMGMDFGRFKADSILSQTHEGPDMGMYLNIIERLAQSLGAGGGALPFANAGSGRSVSGMSVSSSNSGGSGGVVDNGSSAGSSPGGSAGASAGSYGPGYGTASEKPTPWSGGSPAVEYGGQGLKNRPGGLMDSAGASAAYNAEVNRLRKSGVSLTDRNYADLKTKYGVV